MMAYKSLGLWTSYLQFRTMGNVHYHTDSNCFSMSPIASDPSRLWLHFSLRRQLFIPPVHYLEDCSVITLQYHMSINVLRCQSIFATN
jgi:hypothetical protein